MIKYSDNYSPIREYWEAIRSGTVPVSLKVRKTCQHVVERLDRTDGESFYDPHRAGETGKVYEDVRTVVM